MPEREDDLTKPDAPDIFGAVGNVVKIDGLGNCRKRPERYIYQYHGSKCPVCGGVGIPWNGWFNCDGTCNSKAWIETGEMLEVVHA